MPGELPLGRQTTYTDAYDPLLLHPVSRAESRTAIGLTDELPFYGEDIWNAWDLTWLAPHGQPLAASAVIRVPVSSKNIIESKSMKLYLNSLSMTTFDGPDRLTQCIREDLSRAADADVDVAVRHSEAAEYRTGCIDGRDLDSLSVACKVYDVDAGLLSTSAVRDSEETFYTHAFRSLCPVTGQPDLGSVLISYRGNAIEADSLLRYLVSFRQHQDFHEACVERMFIDIVERCAPDKLSVYARFQRRGGIDINPYRSSGAESARNLRLWRQ